MLVNVKYFRILIMRSSVLASYNSLDWIDNIISDLNSREITGKKEHDYTDFSKRYLKGLKELLGQKATINLQEELTDVNNCSTTNNIISGTTVEPSDLKQFEDFTTEGVSDYDTQKEGSGDIVVRPVGTEENYLRTQEFASTEATQNEIDDIINEITTSNASNGTTSENIERFKNTTTDCSSNVTPTGISPSPELNEGDAISGLACSACIPMF